MGTVITGLKNTCFATYGYLMVKKLFDWSGTVGKARNIVMRGFDGKAGWEKKCTDIIDAQKKEGGKPGEWGGLFYTSMQDCISNNSKAIKDEQTAVEAALKSAKNDLKNVYTKDGKLNYAELSKVSAFKDDKIKTWWNPGRNTKLPAARKSKGQKIIL